MWTSVYNNTATTQHLVCQRQAASTSIYIYVYIYLLQLGLLDQRQQLCIILDIAQLSYL